ncbi:hypothetical protein ACKC9G_09770 [Pokkaliibacter sp. CJK22405]|uniref:hypothetical protein n=1 Tax=Pokkaliibacter sp. CJK22405 TaxID=3384615 RepID=UPI003984B175
MNRSLAMSLALLRDQAPMGRLVTMTTALAGASLMSGQPEGTLSGLPTADAKAVESAWNSKASVAPAVAPLTNHWLTKP